MAAGVSMEGKVALITGGSRGIGLATARSFAKLGAHLSICARDSQKLQKAASELQSIGAKVVTIPADLRKPGDIDMLLHKTAESLGPIDVLVNNAGIGTFQPIQEASEADWDNVMETNLKAVFLLCRAVAPSMIERKTGHIVNISSLSGKNTFANGAVYCASKWGLMGLTGCMAEDLRPYGIRVSAVCPGSVATEFDIPGKKDPKKLLQPEDVAHAVETIVTQAPQSFISEILLRPTQKP